MGKFHLFTYRGVCIVLCKLFERCVYVRVTEQQLASTSLKLVIRGYEISKTLGLAPCGCGYYQVTYIPR